VLSAVGLAGVAAPTAAQSDAFVYVAQGAHVGVWIQGPAVADDPDAMGYGVDSDGITYLTAGEPFTIVVSFTGYYGMDSYIVCLSDVRDNDCRTRYAVSPGEEVTYWYEIPGTVYATGDHYENYYLGGYTNLVDQLWFRLYVVDSPDESTPTPGTPVTPEPVTPDVDPVTPEPTPEETPERTPEPTPVPGTEVDSRQEPALESGDGEVNRGLFSTTRGESDDGGVEMLAVVGLLVSIVGVLLQLLWRQ
jgi:hypothetical protein